MYSHIILYAPYIVIWQFCQSSNPDEVQESVHLGVEIGDLWHHWHPRASQGSLSQVLKCHHVACNGPVVRGSENRSAGDFVSPTKWNNLQTKYKNGMPTFQWSNSKNKWICWFLGPEKSQTWGFRLTESHRKDAINIGSPCEMWRPWRSSRTNPPTFIRRSPAGDVAGVASWPDDQRFGGLMLWCFQAWNLGRFPTSCSLLMKWSCHQVTNYAPLRSNKHTLQLEIPISWHMYQICIKSSPDGSPNRGYQYINIYIYIYVYTYCICIRKMLCFKHVQTIKLAVWGFRLPCDAMGTPNSSTTRKALVEVRILQMLNQDRQCGTGRQMWVFAQRCWWHLTSPGVWNHTIFHRFSTSPRWEWWQDMASNCTSLCCNSHRSVMLLTTSRPSSKFKSMGPQIGCRSSTKRMTNGLLTCNSSRAGHVHVPHPSYMTCCTYIYIYKMYTYNHIYTMIRSEDLSWTLCFICATTEVQTRQSKIHHLSPCIDVSLFHKQNIYGYVHMRNFPLPCFSAGRYQFPGQTWPDFPRILRMLDFFVYRLWGGRLDLGVGGSPSWAVVGLEGLGSKIGWSWHKLKKFDLNDEFDITWLRFGFHSFETNHHFWAPHTLVSEDAESQQEAPLHCLRAVECEAKALSWFIPMWLWHQHTDFRSLYVLL